jgi:hypothetical protein
LPVLTILRSIGPRTRGPTAEPFINCLSYSEPARPSGGSLLLPPSRTSITTDQGIHMSVVRGDFMRQVA